jgi:prepilin-type N-terminal cleavage/methylation domain-containing protein
MKPLQPLSPSPAEPAFVRVCESSALRSPISDLRSSGAKRPSTTRHPPLATRHGGFAAFTLIELLVVISIIAILAALAFPAVNGAIESARKAEARNDVQQIAAAIKAFKAEYGKFPTDDINTSDNDVSDNYYSSNSDIISALLGEDDTINPKNLTFLEARAAGRGRSGINDSLEFLDPWGNSYIIKIDTNYNGKTEYYGNRFTSVIVLSPGPDGATGDPDSGSGTGKDDICSFK